MARVHVRPGTDLLDGATGAYVIAIALAANSSEYRSLVRSELEALGLEVAMFEDVEKYSDRVRTGDPERQIRKLAGTVNDGNRVALGTFHAYDASESESS